MKDRSSIFWLTLQKATIARAGPGQTRSQELHWVLRRECRGPRTWTIFADFPDVLARNWFGSRAVCTPTRAPMGCQHCMWWLDSLCQNTGLLCSSYAENSKSHFHSEVEECLRQGHCPNIMFYIYYLGQDK